MSNSTLSPRMVHMQTKEFAYKMLQGLDAPAEVQEKALQASAIHIETQSTGAIRFGFMDPYGGRTTWQTS